MVADDIKLYEVLKEKLGPELAQRMMESLDFQQKVSEQLARCPSIDQIENMLAKQHQKILYGLLAGMMLLQLLVAFWLVSAV